MTASIAQRHQYILTLLREKGHVNVIDLSNELMVSTVTIRKDLKQLEQRGLLFRTHGSAAPNNPYINDRPVNEKEKIRVAQKQNIARFASRMIKPCDSIILASGTTIIEFARQIEAIEQLTVITASLDVALVLSRDPLIEIILLGGMLRKNSSSIVGHYAETMMMNFSCSKLFLGVDGIDPEFGLTTTNAMEATLNQYMIKSAQKLIVLADSTKFGRRGFSRICSLPEVDMVITDDEASLPFTRCMEESGIELVLSK
jgi:DeoR family transcriptional regulator, aga operon transcriptional repressor